MTHRIKRVASLEWSRCIFLDDHYWRQKWWTTVWYSFYSYSRRFSKFQINLSIHPDSWVRNQISVILSHWAQKAFTEAYGIGIRERIFVTSVGVLSPSYHCWKYSRRYPIHRVLCNGVQESGMWGQVNATSGKVLTKCLPSVRITDLY